MIKEIRRIGRQNIAKEKYIRYLQNRGKLKKIVNEDGYLCYDTEELKNYKESVRIGRPPKM